MKKLAALFVFLLSSIHIYAAEVKVAAVEFESKSPGFQENLPGIIEALTTAAKNGAKLMVLPEGVTTGFMYTDINSLSPYADTVPGKTTALVSQVTKKYNAPEQRRQMPSVFSWLACKATRGCRRAR